MVLFRRTVILALGIGALAAPVAGAGSGTHVAIKSWHVYTNDGKLHKVHAGDTYRACASTPVNQLYAKGSVTGAKKNRKFDEHFSVNGQTYTVFHSTWLRNGNFTDYFGIDAGVNTLPAGKWDVKLVQAGDTIGKSHVTIKTKTGC